MTLEQKQMSVGEEPADESLLLEIECLPVKEGTLVKVRSDVLEEVMASYLKGGVVVDLPKVFLPEGAEPLHVRVQGKYEEWLGPQFIRFPDPELWYTELGGQYNPLPLLACGLRSGVSMLFGPTSKPMRDAYVKAMLNWAEDVFNTYGDARGVKGVLRSVKDV